MRLKIEKPLDRNGIIYSEIVNWIHLWLLINAWDNRIICGRKVFGQFSRFGNYVSASGQYDIARASTFRVEWRLWCIWGGGRTEARIWWLHIATRMKCLVSSFTSISITIAIATYCTMQWVRWLDNRIGFIIGFIWFRTPFVNNFNWIFFMEKSFGARCRTIANRFVCTYRMRSIFVFIVGTCDCQLGTNCPFSGDFRRTTHFKLSAFARAKKKKKIHFNLPSLFFFWLSNTRQLRIGMIHSDEIIFPSFLRAIQNPHGKKNKTSEFFIRAHLSKKKMFTHLSDSHALAKRSVSALTHTLHPNRWLQRRKKNDSPFETKLQYFVKKFKHRKIQF